MSLIEFIPQHDYESPSGLSVVGVTSSATAASIALTASMASVFVADFLALSLSSLSISNLILALCRVQKVKR